MDICILYVLVPFGSFWFLRFPFPTVPTRLEATDLQSAPSSVASPMTRQRTLPGNLQPERTGLASRNGNSTG